MKWLLRTSSKLWLGINLEVAFKDETGLDHIPPWTLSESTVIITVESRGAI